MDPVKYLALISTPGMTSSPNSSPAATAWASPSMVSWSVKARAARPLSLARRTRSRGARVPSEALECVCRSIIVMFPCPLKKTSTG